MKQRRLEIPSYGITVSCNEVINIASIGGFYRGYIRLFIGLASTKIPVSELRTVVICFTLIFPFASPYVQA